MSWTAGMQRRADARHRNMASPPFVYWPLAGPFLLVGAIAAVLAEHMSRTERRGGLGRRTLHQAPAGTGTHDPLGGPRQAGLAGLDSHAG
jgi:hypothetical protein